MYKIQIKLFQQRKERHFFYQDISHEIQLLTKVEYNFQNQCK